MFKDFYIDAHTKNFELRSIATTEMTPEIMFGTLYQTDFRDRLCRRLLCMQLEQVLISRYLMAMSDSNKTLNS